MSLEYFTFTQKKKIGLYHNDFSLNMVMSPDDFILF